MTGVTRKAGAGLLAAGLIWQSGAIAQEHHLHHIEPVKPVFPLLGEGQEHIEGARYTLGQLERMALAANPTLAESEAEIRAAQGKRLQAGLYPNPRVGFEGEELRGGAYGGGEKGFFIAQPLITAGKLGLNRKIADQEIQISRQQAEAQRYRILNAVRTAYVGVLAAQEMVETRKALVAIAKATLRVARQLHNIGQADDTEVLQAEIEDQQAEIGVVTEGNTLRRRWTGLLAVVGNPGVPAGGVTGGLDAGLPQLNEQLALDAILKNSPAVKIAQAGVARAVVYHDYQNAKVIAGRYAIEIVPRARKAYELMLQRYGLTLASFTSVLNLQRLLFNLETDYIAALENLKINAVLLDGFLLSGGLDMPSGMNVAEMPMSPVGARVR